MEKGSQFYDKFIAFVLENADPGANRPDLERHLRGLRDLYDQGKMTIITSTDRQNNLNGVLAFLLVPPIVSFESWSDLQSQAREYRFLRETNVIEDVMTKIFGSTLEVQGLAIAVLMTTPKSRENSEAFYNLFLILNSLLENRFSISAVFGPQTFGSASAQALYDAAGFKPLSGFDQMEDVIFIAPPDTLIKS